MTPFRVVVVDDSALFRTLLRNVLAGIPNCEVVASIGDSTQAVERVMELQPDLVTLDVEMPEISGIDILRELKRRRCPSKVVMISRFTTEGAQVTTDALIEGAFDFILKPSGLNPVENKQVLGDALREQILAITAGDATDVESEIVSRTGPANSSVLVRPEAVVIGCSTGGPDALSRIIPDLPGNLSVPVFVVQHMPVGFTASLASRLNEASELEVVEADDGMRVRRGQVVIARGGLHLHLHRRILDSVALKLTDAAPENRCRPAVDYTLRSAVELYQGRLLAVILTGMGRDGTAGCELVRARGGSVIAQHAERCTVYGMPGSVIRSGLANEVVKLPQIASTITQISAGTFTSQTDESATSRARKQ